MLSENDHSNLNRSGRHYLSIENPTAALSEAFTPGGIDVDKAKAKYEDGILEVILPKSQEEQEPNIRVICVR